MTTSHRPQLEARSGAKAAAYTPTGIEHARLLPGHTKLKYRKSKEEYKSKPASMQDGRSYDKCVKEAEVSKEEPNPVEKGFLKEARYDNDQRDSLQELPIVQEAKGENTLKLEQNEQAKERTSSRRSWRKGTAFGHHKVTKGVDIKDDVIKKPKAGYINDMTKSKYHHEFLHKHVR
ncbi:hypothetical protein SMKI_04G3780 [Saccharomyces mikatae IFO 1815]|uniref:Pre-mRNA-splicing factor CWC15 n=1 Tax=Saccharomyces mikatae IFO 1815 TaxID=226126 RepID=A0AA35IW67_SACMI|nr:uncharacterized protein SMKI_04G3780 [Saccharomyces mikatae IFO 1815]CAI4038039.1 hypothetical protein SMKI_04G3780 [Saccharomyces mikatae IFO 1815]